MKSDPQIPAEVNPYASPAEAGGYNTLAAAGIGMWRDGKLIVMHRDAPFPPFCIKTGQPAEQFRPQRLVWYYPIDWRSRRLQLHLPLSETACRAHRIRCISGVAAISLPAVALVAQAIFMRIYSVGAFRIMGTVYGFLWLAGVLFAALTAWRDSRLLKFVRVREDYLWLSGADRRFLNHLPLWVPGS